MQLSGFYLPTCDACAHSIDENSTHSLSLVKMSASLSGAFPLPSLGFPLPSLPL